MSFVIDLLMMIQMMIKMSQNQPKYQKMNGSLNKKFIRKKVN